MKTPDDNDLRRILLTENGGSVSSSLGGVYAYAVPPIDEPGGWIPPATETIQWPCTVNPPPQLSDTVLQDLLARVQRLEQAIADLTAKKHKPRRGGKKPA